MDESELLRHLVAAVEQLGLRYLVTGSTATIAFGEPRFTNDIDVVVEIAEAQLADLLRAFPEPEFYVARDAAEAAVRSHGPFNIIHPSSGLKIGFIVPEGSAFDESRLVRAVRVRVAPGLEAAFATPEDAIVKKLHCFKMGRSDKHLRDIAGVLRVMGDELDRDYVRRWAREFGSEGIWDDLLDQITP